MENYSGDTFPFRKWKNILLLLGLFLGKGLMSTYRDVKKFATFLFTFGNNLALIIIIIFLKKKMVGKEKKNLMKRERLITYIFAA